MVSGTSASGTGKKGKKTAEGKNDDPNAKPKRKYNKDPNKQRKPYKKRAKKGETGTPNP